MREGLIIRQRASTIPQRHIIPTSGVRGGPNRRESLISPKGRELIPLFDEQASRRRDGWRQKKNFRGFKKMYLARRPSENMIHTERLESQERQNPNEGALRVTIPVVRK